MLVKKLLPNVMGKILEFGIGVILLLSFIVPASAQEGSPIYPIHNVYIAENNVFFSWNRIEGASSYNLRIARNKALTNGVQNHQVTNSDTTISLSQDGKYFWRISSGTYQSQVDSFQLYDLKSFQGNQGWYSSLNISQANGTKLQTWNSISNGKNATNSNIGNSPTYYSSGGLGGFPRVDFDGNLRYLNTNITGADIANSEPLEFFFVGKLRPTAQQYAFIFTMANFTAYTPNQHNRGAYNFNFNGSFAWASNGPTTYFLSMPGTTYGVYGGFDDTLNGRIYKNGNQTGNGNASRYQIHPNVPLILGSNVNYNSNSVLASSRMDVHEFLFFDRRLTDSTRNLVNQLLRDRYQPPVSLGADTVIAAMCDTFNFTPKIKYSSYLWSTGETNDTIQIDSSGFYWLEVTDVYNRVSRDTFYVDYYQIEAPENVNICTGDSVLWDPDLPSNYNYNWSNASVDTAIYVSNATSISLTVDDGNGCFKTSPTYSFVFDDYANTASIGNDTTFCQGNFIRLKVGAAETVSYLWMNSSTQNNYQVNSTGNYFVEAVNVNGCVVNDTVLVTINGIAPVVDLEFTSTCNGESTSFTDLSIPSNPETMVGWNWQFGDGASSSNQNPTHTYGAPGTYTVSLEGTASSGCKSEMDTIIVVYELPMSDFTQSILCEKDSIHFTSEHEAGDAPVIGYLWDFGQPSSGAENTSSEQNPKKYYGETGSFNVMLTVSDTNQCSKDTSIQININPTPIASFYHENECFGEAIYFYDQSTVASGLVTTYNWDFNDGEGSTFKNPARNYQVPGTYDVSFIATSNQGCSDDTTISVYVHPIPLAIINVSNACAGTEANVFSESLINTGSIVEYRWEFDDQFASSDESFTRSITEEGQFPIALRVVSDSGCVHDTLSLLVVDKSLNAIFELPSTIVASTEEFELENLSIYSQLDSLRWSFGDGASSSDFTPVYSYSANEEGQSLPITLKIYGSSCVDSMTRDINVSAPEVDLAISDLLIDNQNNKLTIGVEVENRGSAKIEGIDLFIQDALGDVKIEDSSNIILKPGEKKIIVVAETYSLNPVEEDLSSFIVCAEALPKANNIEEDNDLSNNQFCRNLQEGTVFLRSAFPNPFNESIHFDLVAEEVQTVFIELYNLNGGLIKRYSSSKLEQGSNIISINLNFLPSGMYTTKIIGRSNVIQTKIVRQ